MGLLYTLLCSFHMVQIFISKNYFYNHRKVTLSFISNPGSREAECWSPSLSRLAGCPATGVLTGSVHVRPPSWLDACMSEWGSGTHASSRGDDKPQTTFVPLLPASFQSHRWELLSLICSELESKVLVSVIAEHRTGKLADNTQSPFQELCLQAGQEGSVASAHFVLCAWIIRDEIWQLRNGRDIQGCHHSPIWSGNPTSQAQAWVPLPTPHRLLGKNLNMCESLGISKIDTKIRGITTKSKE